MSKKILFLGRHEKRLGHETPELFQRAMPTYLGKDYQVFSAYFEDLLFDCSTGKVSIYDQTNKCDLKAYDFIFLFGWFKLFKDQSLAVAKYLDFHNVKFINPEALHQRSSGKISQGVIFGLNNLPIPRTFYAHSYSPMSKKQIIKELGLPFIFKQLNASKGINNYLITSAKQLDDVIKNHRQEGISFIAQEFIPNDGDLRVLGANNKVHMIIKRQDQSGKTHLHNVSQGALATELPLSSLPAKIHKICVKAGNLLGRSFFGVDLMKNTKTGDYVLLESNNMPQLLSGALKKRKAEFIKAVIEELTR